MGGNTGAVSATIHKMATLSAPRQLLETPAVMDGSVVGRCDNNSNWLV